jgi:hypothetical protein
LQPSFPVKRKSGLELERKVPARVPYGLMVLLKLEGINGVFHNASGLPESITRVLTQAYTLKPPCYQTFMTQLIKSLLLHVLYHFPRNATTGIGDFKQLLKLFTALEMI